MKWSKVTKKSGKVQTCKIVFSCSFAFAKRPPLGARKVHREVVERWSLFGGGR
jgi:hypothetical protein